MKFFAVVFDYNGSDRYSKMIDALKRSIQENTDADLVVERVKKPVENYGTKGKKQIGLVANSIKLDIWKQYSKTMTEETAFIDGDCVVLKDLNHVFHDNFDIGLTYRSKGFPLNAGVVFAQPTAAAREYISIWRDCNEKLAHDWRLHNAYAARYGGINQAAIGMITMSQLSQAVIKNLPCREFNCCDMWDWREIDEQTKVLHAKSELREMVFGEKNHPSLQKAKSIYSTYLI